MKRMKILLNSVAIAAAITGALITEYYVQHENEPQYVPINNSYVPVGEFGIDYNCYYSNGYCTFYKSDSLENSNEYRPCRKGLYMPINVVK